MILTHSEIEALNGAPKKALREPSQFTVDADNNLFLTDGVRVRLRPQETALLLCLAKAYPLSVDLDRLQNELYPQKWGFLRSKAKRQTLGGRVRCAVGSARSALRGRRAGWIIMFSRSHGYRLARPDNSSVESAKYWRGS